MNSKFCWCVSSVFVCPCNSRKSTWGFYFLTENMYSRTLSMFVVKPNMIQPFLSISTYDICLLSQETMIQLFFMLLNSLVTGPKDSIIYWPHISNITCLISPPLQLLKASFEWGVTHSINLWLGWISSWRYLKILLFQVCRSFIYFLSSIPFPILDMVWYMQLRLPPLP